MPLGLLGLKVGMTQIYDDDGQDRPGDGAASRPVSDPASAQSESRDGYDAVQLGFLDKPRRKATRAGTRPRLREPGVARRQQRAKAGVAIPPKADCEPQQHIREFRLDKPTRNKVGERAEGRRRVQGRKTVDVIGTSKGRGTTGAMKRHGFHGLPASHGVKKHHRSPGSVGSLASNRGSGRPKKGKRMAGRYGNARITARNLTVVHIDAENHLILVEGAVPGPNGGLVMIRPTNKKKG